LIRTIIAGIVSFLFIFVATASASTSGTSADPLITLTYAEGSFKNALKTEISQMLGDAADKAIGKLDALFGEYAGYSFSARFESLTLAAGDTVELVIGSSFVLLSGSANISISKGAVVNATTGSEVVSGARLSYNQRYFCAEATVAIIKADSASMGMVDGYYYVEQAKPIRTHPVFKDVLETDWYYDAVDYVYINGLFAGTSSSAFSPKAYMTRGMFVTVLHRLDGLPATEPTGRFTDVQDASLYYYQAVAWANANKIVEGYADGTFKPNDPITREQMATIMHRFADYKGYDLSAPGSVYDSFPDSGAVSSYAMDAMRWVVSNGIINGSNGMLLPRETATRAQVAQIIFNYDRAK